MDIDPIKKLVRKLIPVRKFFFPLNISSFTELQKGRTAAQFPVEMKFIGVKKELQLTITFPGHKVIIILQIYWTDSSLQTIKRAMVPEDPNYLGFAQDLEIEMIRQPDGLAFDWVAR